MPIAGIIAEFNPLHNGHEYLINKAKQDGFTVACVISGNFVQRGDVAIIPKFSRAKAALYAGADIVIELPTPWSMSTAQNFAIGAVSQLSAIGIDTLYFGSECSNTDILLQVADALMSEEYSQRLCTKLTSGHTFAKIRTDAVAELVGDKAKILESPNDTLAVEYICAAKKLNLDLKFCAIKRVGAGHNDSTHKEGYSTATLLRNAVYRKDAEYLQKFMPKQSSNILFSSPVADIRRLDTAIIASLKMLGASDFSSLPDISEGLDLLIYKKIRLAHSYSELCELIKSKRYTMARIRRILLSAFLKISNEYFLCEPPYVRVLGFSKNGQAIIPKDSTKPIITRVSQFKNLSDNANNLFEFENRINEIYALSLDNPSEFTDERSEKLIIV